MNPTLWLLVATGAGVLCLALVIKMVVGLRVWYRHRNGLDVDDE